MKSNNLPSLLSLGFVLVIGCRSPLELSSSWTGTRVSIDGSSADWTSLHIVGSPSLALGAQNDHENLYLCLTTTDPDIQTQILFAGFTVWFPSSHDGARPFGIQFPLRQDRAVRVDERDQFEAMFQAFEPRMISLLILEGSDRQQFSVLQAPGIQVRIGLTSGLLVYELQVPIKTGSAAPYAAIPAADNTVAVNFETTPPNRDELLAGSTRPGRSARRGPGGGPTASIGGSEMPDKLRFHTVIHLGQPGFE